MDVAQQGKPAGEGVVIEAFSQDRPHAGKVLAVVQAHADDIPFYCGGTVAKLIAEGYKGYLIQTTNDEKCGPTASIGETVLSNEREVDALADVLGLEEVVNLGYRNHRMDQASPVEVRARMILLLRAWKVDTVITFNPWGHDEENPDHYVTGHAVEEARWMAGMDKDYPEHLAVGIEAHPVRERYYWVGRKGQPYNRVVDISHHVEAKVEAMAVNKSQGPAGSTGSRLKARLAAKGLRLPELGDDAETADREYARMFMLGHERELGERHGLAYAEPFLYFGPPNTTRVDEDVGEHAVPLA